MTGEAPAMDAGEPAADDRSIGGYELLNKLGEGAMGVVYKARQIRLNRLVALKMLKPNAGAPSTLIRRMLLEAEAAGKLRHPNIVAIHDIGRHAGQPFISMELIQGAALNEFITDAGFCLKNDGPVQAPRRRAWHEAIAQILVKVARAVDYAHRHGVLHRDLKPGNIVLDEEGEPHLTDFGLAKLLKPKMDRGAAIDSEFTEIKCTPPYASPEQARGERATVASDVYGLGAVLYHMLAGRPPFRGSNPWDTLRKVTEEDPEPPQTWNAELDRNLAAICLKCLEKDPPERYSSARGLADDLERWIRREPIEAKPVGWFGKVGRWCHREPVLAGMVLGLVLLLAATSTFALIALQLQKKNFADAIYNADITLRLLKQRVDDEWERVGMVRITAEEQSMIDRRQWPAAQDNLETKRYLLGIYSSGLKDDPNVVIERHFPVIQNLEATMLNLPVHQSIRLDILMFKDWSDAVEALVQEKVALMQCTATMYVCARRSNANLTVLVQHEISRKPDTHGVIFASTNFGCKSIQDLKLKPLHFAFGDQHSSLGDCVPKAALADLGLHTEHFLSCSNFATRDVLNAVVSDQFAVGVAEASEVTNAIATGAPLTILLPMSSPNNVWVATTNLAPATAVALTKSLLTLRNLQILGKIPGLTGFCEPHPGDFTAMEEQMKKAKHFEGPADVLE